VTLFVFPALWYLSTVKLLAAWIFWAFCVMSVLAFVAYGLDKRASTSGTRRTPEKTLQVIALLCGWPGALLAQQAFRHKSSKSSFQLVFWAMVFLNIAVVAFIGSPYVLAMIRG